MRSLRVSTLSEYEVSACTVTGCQKYLPKQPLMNTLIQNRIRHWSLGFKGQLN